jgi:arginine deiminase
MDTGIQVTSEVGTLKAVLLHRPGRELESLTPEYLDSMLFEDIPFLEQMQEEHDLFAKLLESQGCTVHYLESLLEEVFADAQLCNTAVNYLIGSSHLLSPSLKTIIEECLLQASPKQLVTYCIAGLLKSEVDSMVRQKTLSYFIRDTYPYYISPLPNLYFTRDPATVVGNGLCLNVMKKESRRRENWLISLLAQHHTLFQSTRIHSDYTMGSNIEGGDILILNNSCAIIGSSARTDVWAIEAFAKKIMDPVELGGEGFREVLVIQIPYTRAYMHLDTVFTMVDRDAFCIFPGVEPSLRVFRMVKGTGGALDISEEPNLKQALKRTLALPAVNFIKSGGDDSIASAREQWNDSTNTLAIAPGTVVTYRRNVVSNETLVNNGITVFPIQGSELVRGRGGPRCMSMPLKREPPPQ